MSPLRSRSGSGTGYYLFADPGRSPWPPHQVTGPLLAASGRRNLTYVVPMSFRPIRSVKSNVDVSVSAFRRRSSPPYQASQAPRAATQQREKSPIKPGLTLKFGAKHHAFPDVPWPLSYEPEILDLDVLYHQLVKEEYGLTFLDFSEGPPRRILDLGCGLGTWILDAASQWTDAEFVGFDIVPIQPALGTPSLDPDLQARIQWVNGNFLQRLPFDDNSFDFVRCNNVAHAIPENQWLFLCQELFRIMTPSGALEMTVHNIVFPYIPRIVTQAVTPLESPTSPLSKEFRGLERHDHPVLEKLFFALFERRFINVRPTSIVANYLNIHFKQVTESPIYFHPLDEGSSNLRPRPSAWANEFAAWQAVLGCKETMWEEAVLVSQETGEDLFQELPLAEEQEGFTMRQRFELLFERYEQEMRGRTGLSVALEKGLGWKEPGKKGVGPGLQGLEEDLETFSKGQIALSQSSSEDVDTSRQISCFVGFKGGPS